MTFTVALLLKSLQQYKHTLTHKNHTHTYTQIKNIHTYTLVTHTHKHIFLFFSYLDFNNLSRAEAGLSFFLVAPLFSIRWCVCLSSCPFVCLSFCPSVMIESCGFLFLQMQLIHFIVWSVGIATLQHRNILVCTIQNLTTSYN